MDEIVILKKLMDRFEFKSLTYRVVVYFVFYHFGELVLLKNYICFLIVVSGVFFVGYILDKNFEKNDGCLFNLWKNVRDVSFVFVYLSLISILLFNMLIVGIYLEINGIPMILCLISVI